MFIYEVVAVPNSQSLMSVTDLGMENRSLKEGVAPVVVTQPVTLHMILSYSFLLFLFALIDLNTSISIFIFALF